MNATFIAMLLSTKTNCTQMHLGKTPAQPPPLSYSIICFQHFYSPLFSFSTYFSTTSPFSSLLPAFITSSQLTSTTIPFPHILVLLHFFCLPLHHIFGSSSVTFCYDMELHQLDNKYFLVIATPTGSLFSFHLQLLLIPFFILQQLKLQVTVRWTWM